MSLKKFLKRQGLNAGQMMIEYFILLVVVAALTIFATSKFFSDAKNSCERAVNGAVEKIAPPHTAFDGKLEDSET